MQPSKEQREFERGVIKENFSALPANRSIIPDEDGTAQQSAHPRELAKIKRAAQGPPKAIKQEMKPSNEVFTRNSKSKIAQKHKTKEEHPHLDHVDLPSREPLEPIDADIINNAKIRQEPMDFEILDEKAMVISKETAMDYDLMELVDASVLLEPSTPSANPEDSVYLEMAEEICDKRLPSTCKLEDKRGIITIIAQIL
ncbi:hypothetical protein BCON_0095g00050 [Botryotinia convoluta]|uniref:Uncharacterized protein n=1 Tax=Botryotinia convoluta TaxID=54673 RepID=A0A4Z1I157_9HELO|nr:hypothetical protein BCON_0095g00050 [Botryotinia convoluta]